MSGDEHENVSGDERQSSERTADADADADADGGVRVGVDVGGTFTDVVILADGDVHVSKTPSTPDGPEDGVLDGLAESSDTVGFDPGNVSFLGHGTTVATNAVLEGTWADTALVTTAGFRDVLEIARQDRPDIYDFDAEKPAPVVPRHRRFEVPERLDERGAVLEDLDDDAVREVAAGVRDGAADSVAVALLFAFENGAHERRVRDLLRDEGVDAPISLSSVVLPELREYERTQATALNAALRPVVDTYLGNLETRVRDLGVGADLRIMQSNGGLGSATAARRRPVQTLLSGPAAGVRGAAFVARTRGVEDLLTMDMGGTSCDVSLVTGGDPVVATDVAVGDYAVGVPMVDVHTVGSGGGSIAWVDDGGALRVGPQSAGAVPGPVAYGRGGTAPTTTDAHLLCGRLDPGAFEASDFDTSVDDVRAAFAELGDELGVGADAAARGVLDVANANMQRALRVVSVERGHDPREFALLAFGGAGPLHACRLAADLDIPRVLVPRAAGVLSALGILVSDLVYDESVSRVRPIADADPGELRDAFADLREVGEERLDAAGVDADRRRFERTADLRYAGQSFDLSVPVPEGDVDADALDALAARFHDRHEQRYGHADRSEPVELVTLRLRARGVVDPPELDPPTADGTVEDAIRETRDVTFDGDPRTTRVYDRERLPADASFDGPAVVEGAQSTLVVHPGQAATVDDHGTIVVETGGGR